MSRSLLSSRWLGIVAGLAALAACSLASDAIESDGGGTEGGALPSSDNTDPSEDGGGEADAPAEEPPAPEVLTTADALTLELPELPLSAGTALTTLPAGSGEGQVGFFDPAPREGEGDGGSSLGPAAVDVDGDGRTYVLDRVNARVLRLTPTGTVEAHLPIPDGRVPLAFGVGTDGAFAVHFGDANDERIVLYDVEGNRLAIAPLSPELWTPSAILVSGADVRVEVDQLEVHPVIRNGVPLPAELQVVPDFPGLPTADGGSLSGALLEDQTAAIRLSEPDGSMLREVEIRSPDLVESMPVLAALPDGGVVAVLLTRAEGELRYHALKFDAELGLLRSERFAPRVDRALARDLAVRDDGTVVQLRVQPTGIELVTFLAAAPGSGGAGGAP